jgi:hypothetical protein
MPHFDLPFFCHDRAGPAIHVSLRDVNNEKDVDARHEAGHDDQLGERRDMTAYLISLALAGLIAIAVWEGFS